MIQNTNQLIQIYLQNFNQATTYINKYNCLKSLTFAITNNKNESICNIQNILNLLSECLKLDDEYLNIAGAQLLQYLIWNYSKQQFYQTLKKKLLRQLIKGLGHEKIQLRKYYHKCLLSFVKKYEDYDSIIFNYLRQGIQNNHSNQQLKQKCLNSFQSILLLQYKKLNFTSHFTKRIFENIINMLTTQQETQQVQKAATQCIVTICRLSGVRKLFNVMQNQYINKLQQLGIYMKDLPQDDCENQDKRKNQSIINQQIRTRQKNNQYGKINSIVMSSQNNNKKVVKINASNQYFFRKPYNTSNATNEQLINEQLLQAEQMLKRIQQYKNDIQMVDQIFDYLPKIDHNFHDKRIQMFNISIRIIQVILEIQIRGDKFYIKIVPSIIERLDCQKFLIRNTINKLIKQHLKTYTIIWIQNFLNSLQKSLRTNFKEELINLLNYGFQTYLPFKFDYLNAITIIAKQTQNKRKLIKTKAISCIQLILKFSNKSQIIPQLKSILSQQVYMDIIGRSLLSTPKFINSELIVSAQHISRYTSQNNGRQGNNQNSQETQKQYKSSQKKIYKNIRRRNDRIVTQIQNSQKIFFRKSQNKNSKQFTNENVNRQKKQTQMSIQSNKHITNQNVYYSFTPEQIKSPTKIKIQNKSPQKGYTTTTSKVFKDQGLEYISKQQLPLLTDAKKQIYTICGRLRDKFWKTQFLAQNKLRSLIEYNEELVQQNLNQIIEQLLKSILSLRSSICKNGLICLSELIKKLRRKLDGHIQLIMEKIMKKTLSVNEFLQQQIKNCLISIGNNMNQNKLLNILLNYKDSKSINVKNNILIILQNLLKNQKVFKKDHELIWNFLISFIEQPALQIREQTKKIIIYITQNYQDWKQLSLKYLNKQIIQKISYIQKKYTQVSKFPNQTLKKSHFQINKDLPKKISLNLKKQNQNPKKNHQINTAFSQFNKLDQFQKPCRNHKDWKNRIYSIQQIFKSAFKYPQQFVLYSNSPKYMHLLCQHIQDPHIKVSLNALKILQQCIIIIKQLVQQHITQILVRLINGMANKKTQYCTKCESIYNQLKQQFDKNKLVKQLLKVALSPLQKTKITSLKLLDQLVQNLNKQSLGILSPMIIKFINKMNLQQKSIQINQKIKILTNSIANQMNQNNIGS